MKKAVPNYSSNEKTFLGFDFGLKRIGVAVGNTVTMQATPLKTLNAKNGEPNWQEITQLIEEWQPDAIVVGIPLNMDGEDLSVTDAARNFAKKLVKNTQLPVHQADERLTTKTARAEIFAEGGYKALKKQAIDSVAAKLILEAFMRKPH